MKIINTLPSFIYKKTPPKNFNEKDEFLIETKREESIPEMNLYSIDHAWLYEDGSIFKNNKLVIESLRDGGMINVYNWRRKLKNLFFRKIKSEHSLNISINDHWSHEYYHWFFEALPRLVFIKQNLNKDFNIYLSHRHKKQYISESLKSLGVSKVTYLPKKSKVYLDNLYFSDYAGPSDFHRQELLLAIKEHFPKKTPSRNIFISRQNARYRKILNIDEVTKILTKHNFEIVFAEDLNFSEQVDLFSNTKNLISIHGAGLTNILFMQPNTNILEIRKNSWGMLKDNTLESSKFYNTYYHICNLTKLNYYYLNAKANDDLISCHFADLNVDVRKLENTIKEMLSPH